MTYNGYFYRAKFFERDNEGEFVATEDQTFATIAAAGEFVRKTINSGRRFEYYTVSTEVWIEGEYREVIIECFNLKYDIYSGEVSLDLPLD